MELKEGMYVRTKNLGGSIEKIIEIIPKEKTPDLKTRYITDVSREHGLKITDDYIIGEPSYNLIDLIEVGDYVNGKRVYNISIVDGLKYLDVEVEDYLSDTPFINADQITSIVTKEQFESVKYKVE